MTRPAHDAAPSLTPETLVLKETSMTVVAAPALPARSATSRAPSPRGVTRQAAPARSHGETAQPRGTTGPRARATPTPRRGDLLDAEAVPVVPLVRVSGPRVVADLDELADRARRLTSGTPDAAGTPAGAAHPAEPADLPDPTRLCCAVVRGAVEVVRGDRPVAQLARWVTPAILEALTTRAALVRGLPRPNRVPRPALVRRARVVRLGPAAAEATVVVEDVDRVRAAALRVEAHRGQWRVVALEIG